MPEIQNPVQTLFVNYLCDKPDCDGVYQRSTATVQMSDPPQYQHTCSVCSDIQNFKVSYPVINYLYIKHEAEAKALPDGVEDLPVDNPTKWMDEFELSQAEIDEMQEDS